MRKSVCMLLFSLLLIGGLWAKSTVIGKVTAVKDGDTIEVLSNRTLYKVRLDGIDCPEKKQPWGTQAKSFVSNAAFGKKVRLVISSKDRYGRYLAFVYLPNGKNLNHELLKHGLAWHYKQYSKDKKMADMEAIARKNKTGLWSDKNPQAPWEYRKKTKNINRLPNKRRSK